VRRSLLRFAPASGKAREPCKYSSRREGHASQSHSDGVVDGIGDGGRHSRRRHLSHAARPVVLAGSIEDLARLQVADVLVRASDDVAGADVLQIQVSIGFRKSSCDRRLKKSLAGTMLDNAILKEVSRPCAGTSARIARVAKSTIRLVPTIMA